ncbi:DUF1345 domain-containing protein [Methylovulum psychrotolerans]|jgi:uncharacterized membrane protein|uniref:DUF1345 domain-containing protein n=1 Tax=Methylovulum psychrotolerans TaxID=1704499 RepID=A0A1Z4BTG7_9GAMM|nr:DUF1345 domain-containing protein [Methylovulum psychrotolerans]ASF44604.1 hypothetical protein CEK71_00165 [Methylovulum psychrotolerans]MBT9098692.1 DUF1345 domain-containing protein [Methylovulum psychrotolerans]
MTAIVRFFNHHPHPRLVIAVLLSLLSACLLPAHWRLVTQILVAWNVLVWSYLVLMGWLMLPAKAERVLKIANQEDEHGAMILTLFSVATVVSFVAIILELSSNGLTGGFRLFHYLLTGATILGSWLFTGVQFTFHYSRLYYAAPPQQRPLLFPGDGQHPDYWDFLYFAFTIAVAAQTADVAVTGHSMRKAVLAQSVLSFLFNVTIIGLSINVMASLIS